MFLSRAEILKFTCIIVTQFLSNIPFPINSLTSSPSPPYSEAVLAATFASNALPIFFSCTAFSKNTSVACAIIMPERNFTTSRLKSVDGAWRKLSLMYVSIPAAVRK